VEESTPSLDEVCVAWWPRVSSFAFLLTGNRSLAHRIAKRTIARAVAHWRDRRNPYALDAWLNRTVVAMSLRAHVYHSVVQTIRRRPRSIDQPPGASALTRRLWQELHGLRFKARAAVVLVHHVGTNDSQTADALGTSVAGARSLVSNGIESLGERMGSDVVASELPGVLQTLSKQAESRSARFDGFCRRVRAARLIGVVEATALVAAVAVGVYMTSSSLARNEPTAETPQVVNLDEDGGLPGTRQIGGAPGWCPTGPVSAAPDLTVDNRTGIGQTFVVALTKRYEDGLRRYTDSVMLRVAPSTGPHPSQWPRLPSVSGLRIRYQGKGTEDVALRRTCGATVARGTWIIVYVDESSGRAFQLAVYLLQRQGEWKVWGTYEPALIL
jgi:DNA-directed RNA polymerase specialized sigma24 family protein